MLNCSANLELGVEPVALVIVLVGIDQEKRQASSRNDMVYMNKVKRNISSNIWLKTSRSSMDRHTNIRAMARVIQIVWHPTPYNLQDQGAVTSPL